ncbi:hypothetical protein [Streptomyces sp. NPDC006368]|uniref:hypothetical protein n=1 Tax=Streptomyces sp. NPDC006368 TaxID=3156760 RepID=UPI00339F0C7F
MSGDLSGGVSGGLSGEAERGELRFVLRDLSRSGGEVLRPCELRRRRRRAVGAGLVAVVVLGAVALLPGSRPGVRGTPVSVWVSVDAGAERLTVERGGEPVRVLVARAAGGGGRSLPAGRLTVVAKSARRGEARWVVELAGPEGFVGRVWAGPGEGAVALRDVDAEWLHGELEVGDVVEVR